MPLSSHNDEIHVHGTILSLARLDAVLPTVAVRLSEDRSNNIKGHRQKLYNNMFGSVSIFSLQSAHWSHSFLRKGLVP